MMSASKEDAGALEKWIDILYRGASISRRSASNGLNARACIDKALSNLSCQPSRIPCHGGDMLPC